MTPEFIIGLDVSLTATGIANRFGALYTSKGGVKDARLRRLYGDVLHAATGADAAVLEDLPMSGHSAALLGNAQGVVKLALFTVGIPYVTVVPSTLKKWATGHGNADKSAMFAAVPRADHSMFANVSDDNQVDAYWLRKLGMAYLAGEPVPEAVKWTPWDGK